MKQLKDFMKYLAEVSTSSILEMTKQDVLYEIVDFMLIIVTVTFYTYLNLSDINLAMTIFLLVCNRSIRKFKKH
jgi:hypothetical protein